MHTLLTVPPPSITLTGSPLDEDFHLGLLFTITGRAEFNHAVDTHLNVDSYWSKANLLSDLSNANITSAVQVAVSPMVYVTNLTVYLLDMETDSGDYSLTFNVTSGPFTAGTSNTTTRLINVMSMSILYVLGYITL